jgi:putative DNA primase/helicase
MHSEFFISRNIPAPPSLLHKHFTCWGKNNRYSAVLLGDDGLYFEDFVTGITESWFLKRDVTLSPEELKRRKAAIRKAQEESLKLRQEENESAAKKAANDWGRFSETGTSPYLERKLVRGYGVRYGTLGFAVPMYDIDGKLCNLQIIYPDGKKRFQKGAKKKGCFHVIGDFEPDGLVFVCEGYATAATVHLAIGKSVIVAFDAGNIDSVIASVKSKYPNITLIICADDDQWGEVNIGKIKSEAVAVKYSCEVVMPEFSESLQSEKPTDWNDLHVLAGLDEVKRQLAKDLPEAAAYTLPECFRVDEGGVYYIDPKNDNPLNLCSKLEITASTSDEEDRNHGLVLEWVSVNTGKKHLWAMPCRFLAGEGVELREKLLDEGLRVSSSRQAREKLHEYIQSAKPKRKILGISRVGWHGDYFILPDAVYPPNKDMVLQSNEKFENFRVSGALREWQENIAVYASGNSRLIFALSFAFAAPLLKITGEESGIIHFFGASSTGKTSTLRLAASVWGGGGENGFIKQWRSTANAQEAIAEQHRDCLLPLDELGQADSRTVGDTVYMIANNQGKKRMSSDARLNPSREWRVSVISSGEITLEIKMQEAGKKALAGMEVRFINIPAEVEDAYGIFEELHKFESGHELSRHLQDSCSKYYGTPIRAFLEGIAGKTGTLIDTIRKVQKDFNDANVKDNFSGQVKRVAERFGLIAAGGELAIAIGILPLNARDAFKATSRCFNDWLKSRGSSDNLETDKAITQIKEFIERYGPSKFITLDEYGHEINQIRPNERVGYRQLENGVYHYYVLPEAYKSQLCKGYNPREVTKALAGKGYLIQASDGKNQVIKTFPGEPKQRVYHISPTIVDGDN